MSLTLTPEMIEKARALRSEKMPFRKIAEQIGYTGAATNLRYHCRDLPPTRILQAPTRFAEGTGIRAFDADEDAKVIAWFKQPEGERATYEAFGAELGRNAASVRARVAWLKKNGMIAD